MWLPLGGSGFEFQCFPRGWLVGGWRGGGSILERKIGVFEKTKMVGNEAAIFYLYRKQKEVERW